MSTNYFAAARPKLVAEMLKRMRDSQESLYQEREFSPEAVAKFSEEEIRDVCKWPTFNIDVDDFVRRAVAEAVGEEDSLRGASSHASSEQSLAPARRLPSFEAVQKEATNKVQDLNNIASWLHEQYQSTLAEKKELVLKVQALETELARMQAMHERDRQSDFANLHLG